MNLNFLYINCIKDIQKEKVITNICLKAKQHISLPEILDIEVQNFSGPNYQREYRSVLAETVLDLRLKVNRIRVNSELSSKEIVIPLVHELVHLNQIVEGRLSVYKNGDILWEGKRYQLKDPKKSTYEYYQNLPWEVDVRGRESKLLKTILDDL
jgi:hypothetical protein